ncbi:MAG TPA: hypothetical protein VHG91_06880 [Longimicrobium sp.]|nr:hypothetical protein [Longimicrobium sp.]
MARQLEEVDASLGTDEDTALERELRALGLPVPPGALSAFYDLPRYPRWVERLLTPVAWVLRKIDRSHAERSRARFRAGMKELEAELAEFDDDFPPLDEEEIERLRASGVHVPDRTGPLPDWDWEPAPKRPRWLAFLFRVLRIWK